MIIKRFKDAKLHKTTWPTNPWNNMNLSSVMDLFIG